MFEHLLEIRPGSAELSIGREEATESHLMMEAELTAVVSACVSVSPLKQKTPNFSVGSGKPVWFSNL